MVHARYGRQANKLVLTFSCYYFRNTLHNKILVQKIFRSLIIWKSSPDLSQVKFTHIVVLQSFISLSALLHLNKTT